MVNHSKSKIWYSHNTSLGMIQSITTTLHIPSTKDLGTYLGFPLIHGRLRSQHFQYLLEKVQGRLAGWKSHLLSQVARLVLIQSVTTTIPMYVMQCCKLQQQILSRLEKVNCRFFWMIGITNMLFILSPGRLFVDRNMREVWG